MAAHCTLVKTAGPSDDELTDARQSSSPVAARFWHSLATVLLFEEGKVGETMVGVQPKQRYEQAIRKVAARYTVFGN